MKNRWQKGFALPSVLIISAIMFAVLVFAVATVSSLRASLMSEYYNQMAREASAAGIAYAKSCLAANNGIPAWSDNSPLGPGTDCSGATLSGLTCSGTDFSADCFVMSSGNIRSTFSIGMPAVNDNGKAISINSSGKVYLVRTADQSSVWRSYTQNTYEPLKVKGIVSDNLYWSFDAGNISSYSRSSNETNWVNVSPNNVGAATLSGGVGYSSSNGGILTLDGTNDYASVGVSTAAYSVEMWIKPSSTQSTTSPTYYNQGSTAETSSAGYWWAYTDGTNTTLWFRSSKGPTSAAPIAYYVSWASAITYDQWNHLVIVINSNTNTITLYKNGVSLGSYAFPDEALPSGNFYAGAYQGSSNYLKGSIANLNIYSRPLTDTEVIQNYNALRSRYGL